MLIDTFVNAIFLYDDKMVITINYKDGTDTITFDGLKAALNKKNTGSDLDCSTAPSEYPPGYSDFFISKIILKKLYRNMQLFACFPLYYEK